MINCNSTNNDYAKPFLKWAGGKSQLLPEIEKRLPPQIRQNKTITTYIEPFIGGGALFFFLKKNYHIQQSVILDINPELITAYKTLQRDPGPLIRYLKRIETAYKNKSPEARSRFFYLIRRRYNRQGKDFDHQTYSPAWINRTAWLIFLNRTCFNGLFRQNFAGEFNVPFGSYKNPCICDEANIQAVSAALENTIILQGDFVQADPHITPDTFIYMDPPYRPLSKTASFNMYSQTRFTDAEQERLSYYFKTVVDKGANVLLSNSDPRNEEKGNTFFEDLYRGYSIERVSAKRMINCNSTRRGKITEIMISNYHQKASYIEK